MSVSRRRLFGAALAVAVAFSWIPSFKAHEHSGCLELNNVSNNRIGVFQVIGATGVLQRVQEVTTGGIGRNGGYVSIPQIAATAPEHGRACLFAANAATNDVSAFQVTIEQEAGTPCPCHNKAAGGPVSIGPGAVFGPLGGGLAVAPDGKMLYTANPGSSDISTFSVASSCAIKLAGPRVPSPVAPADIQVKPDGRCLATSSPDTNTINMYSIGPAPGPEPGFEPGFEPLELGLERRLVSAGVFTVPGPGRASGLEFTSRVDKSSLYVSKAAPGQTVIVRFEVTEACTLSATNTITTVPTGRTSSLARLDPENRCLFAPNHTVATLAVNHPPSTLSAFRVDGATGALTHVTTVDDVAFYPAGMDFASTYNGERFLYYTSFTREIFRRPIRNCVPGPVVRPGISGSENTTLPATGPLRSLTIIQ